MLEKMGEFFDSRLAVYDEHQLNCIASAKEFYPFTASLLPKEKGVKVLDLGCGTGLELEEYFIVNPDADVTGIDLAPGMLRVLTEKFADKNIHTVCDSYFDVPFGENAFDAVVSVESLHHFTADKKLPLYEKIHNALKKGCAFVLTDYFSLTDEEEKAHRETYLALRKAEGIPDGEFYHYDTPLTLEHEMGVLLRSGFEQVTVMGSWAATRTLVARKE